MPRDLPSPAAPPTFDSCCFIGDGEPQEGTVWGAVMDAGLNHLDNLCILVDRNEGKKINGMIMGELDNDGNSLSHTSLKNLLQSAKGIWNQSGVRFRA